MILREMLCARTSLLNPTARNYSTLNSGQRNANYAQKSVRYAKRHEKELDKPLLLFLRKEMG